MFEMSSKEVFSVIIGFGSVLVLVMECAYNLKRERGRRAMTLLADRRVLSLYSLICS